MDKKQAELILQKVKAGIAMLSGLQKDLETFIGGDFIEKSEEETTYVVEESWLGDDGKEYKEKTPYIKSKTWYCCGQPLERIEVDGKQVFHCTKCNSKYRA